CPSQECRADRPRAQDLSRRDGAVIDGMATACRAVSSGRHTGSVGIGRAWSALMLAALTMPGAGSATPALAIDIDARQLMPGELVVVTIGADRPLSSARVNIFGRIFPAFEVADRQWRALIGI